VAVDKNNNVYVADAYNHRIRMIDPLQNVTVIAGSGSTGVGNGGYANGAAISTASLNVPTEVSCDSTGAKIYIGDTFSNRVRSLFGGVLNNIAGSGTQGYLNGLDVVAQFNYTRGVVSNPQGTKIYVVDYNNNCVRKIYMASPTGIVENNAQESAPSLFPSPNTGKFTILNKGKSVLKIMDTSGRIILEQEFSNELNVELSNFESGLYSAIISNDSTTKAIRFVTEK
jgi:DNA-binding beta-propeller fold protein YncE